MSTITSGTRAVSSFVQLTARRETLAARVGCPSRQEHGKILDPALLDHVLRQWDFSTRVPFEPNLVVDTDEAAPEDAAELIAATFGLTRITS